MNTYIMYIDTTSKLLPLGTEMHVSVVIVIKLELLQYLNYSKPQDVCKIEILGC